MLVIFAEVMALERKANIPVSYASEQIHYS